MEAELLSVGTELVLGQTVDSNSAWLAEQLAGLGIRCQRHVTVGDELEPIRAALAEGADRADLMIVTGGLGPTPDDLTREALAAAMGVDLVEDAASLRPIERFFEERRRPMHAANRRQAMVPRGAETIPNAWGTAPGIRARLGRAEVILLPGVPSEMQAMFAASVRPRLAAGGRVIVRRVLHSIGMSESEIGEKIADLMGRGRNPEVGTSASELVISIRINATAESEREASVLAGADVAAVRARLGTCIFGEGEESIGAAVGRLLIGRGQTVCAAESCTGGLIAVRLTDVPGSSAYVVQGVVPYANEAKATLLGVPRELIERHGAVSAEVARDMAERCREQSRTDYALSATGVAGPTGGTADKPIGRVYVGLAGPRGVSVKELNLGSRLSRDQVRERTARIALNLLRLELLATGE